MFPFLPRATFAAGVCILFADGVGERGGPFNVGGAGVDSATPVGFVHRTADVLLPHERGQEAGEAVDFAGAVGGHAPNVAPFRVPTNPLKVTS